MKTRFAPTALTLAMLAPLAAWSQVSISIGIAPPPLPVYSQPQVPGDGYLWTPGYWAWNGPERDYYWVPGTWVMAPRPGYLWTPGYWGYGSGGYRWNIGYWGPRVGFYGGIDYGHGYNGHGYEGGRWQRGAFHYNTAVNNVNTTIVHNVYNTKVVNKTVNITRVSYNGGATGVRARPTAVEEQVRREKHIDATPNQVEHERTAMREPEQKASVNHGAPKVAATPKPAAFDAPQAVKASNPAARADKPSAAHDDKGGNTANSRKTAGPAVANTEPQATPKAARSRTKETSGSPPAAPQAAAVDAPPDRAAQPHSKSASRQPAPQQVTAKPAPSEPNAKGRDAAQADAAQPRAEAKPHGKGGAQQDTSKAHAQGDAEPNGKQRQ